MTTLADLLRAAPDESTRRDMEVLLTAALGVQRAYLYAHGDEPLTGPGAAQLERMLADYRRGTPIAYVIGRREFWKLSLEVSRDVLIPRPETELLVELVLLRLRPRARVLDLGTGSGAIALAIKQERNDCAVNATDISAAAIETARRNASTHGLDLNCRVGSWYSVAEDSYDLIVSNPPYIAESDPHLEALVSEPRIALSAGSDGLDALRIVVSGAPSHLTRGGWLLVEHGHDQGVAVRGLFEAAGLHAIETHQDLAGLDRVTLGKR